MNFGNKIITFDLLKNIRMRRFRALVFILALIGIFQENLIAQTKPVDKVASVKESGHNILFSITSTKPFVFGNNRYVLYIGRKEFKQYEQSKKNGRGLITFFIPVSDFKNLQDGEGMFLCYGSIEVEELDMDALAKQSRKCWALGKFKKSILTK